MLSKLIFSLFISSAAFAGTYKDVTLPDTETVAGKKLVLNGMGLREVTVMGIDIRVYVSGLYLEKKSTSADEIMKQKYPKKVRMHFLRKVSERDYKKSWKEIILDHCPKEGDNKGCAKIKDKLDAFLNLLKEVKSGEELEFTFDGKGFDIQKGAEKWGRVDDAELATYILSGWLGVNGVKVFDEGLQRGFLGGNKI